mmetsp:Transcript_37580/g.101903  ORF Transcript_37580/g.101903 Transcript_37580/m.101903 type:complete len:374 (-) Transcript_37580:321-1442(-)
MLKDGLISPRSVKTVVFDEADTLLGSDVDGYNQCKELCSRRLKDAQVLFFSATFTEELKMRVRTDFLQPQGKPPTPLNVISLVVTEKQEGVIDANMLCQCAVDCMQKGETGGPIGKFDALREMYQTLDMSGGTLVFVRTKVDAATIHRGLHDLGMKPCLITGDTEKGPGPNQRDGIFKRFRDTEEFNVCICTDLLGKGVDITKVTIIINYDLPDEKDQVGTVGAVGTVGTLRPDPPLLPPPTHHLSIDYSTYQPTNPTPACHPCCINVCTSHPRSSPPPTIINTTQNTGHFKVSTTSYLQRGGRSTRGGSKGVLINLCNGDNDMNDVRTIERHFFGQAVDESGPNSVIKLIPPNEAGEFETENLQNLIKDFLA